MDVSQPTAAGPATDAVAGAAGMILLTLASAQFLMTLDSSVMNVSIATVAKDVGTTMTGIQAAITFYTLVMASLMITGGRLGKIFGRLRLHTAATAPARWLHNRRLAWSRVHLDAGIVCEPNHSSRRSTQ